MTNILLIATNTYGHNIFCAPELNYLSYINKTRSLYLDSGTEFCACGAKELGIFGSVCVCVFHGAARKVFSIRVGAETTIGLAGAGSQTGRFGRVS